MISRNFWLSQIFYLNFFNFVSFWPFFRDLLANEIRIFDLRPFEALLI